MSKEGGERSLLSGNDAHTPLNLGRRQKDLIFSYVDNNWVLSIRSGFSVFVLVLQQAWRTTAEWAVEFCSTGVIVVFLPYLWSLYINFIP